MGPWSSLLSKGAPAVRPRVRVNADMFAKPTPGATVSARAKSQAYRYARHPSCRSIYARRYDDRKSILHCHQTSTYFDHYPLISNVFSATRPPQSLCFPNFPKFPTLVSDPRTRAPFHLHHPLHLRRTLLHLPSTRLLHFRGVPPPFHDLRLRLRPVSLSPLLSSRPSPLRAPPPRLIGPEKFNFDDTDDWPNPLSPFYPPVQTHRHPETWLHTFAEPVSASASIGHRSERNRPDRCIRIPERCSTETRSRILSS